jgi:hypothetical protein
MLMSYCDMAASYCDMAAAFVNNGAINMEVFNDTNGEHIGVFSKLEPVLGDIPASYGRQFAANLKKLITETPNGRERAATARERMKGIRAELAGRQARTAQQS